LAGRRRVMEQRIRFCKTADGVRIAYATVGEGPPLVLAGAWVGNLQFEWEHRYTRRFYEELARGRTLVRFDKRGSGLSDRDPDDYSMDTRMRDLDAVVAALGLQHFALMGFSESGPTAATYASRHPEAVTQLVLYGSYARWPYPAGVADVAIALVRAHWGAGSAAMSALFGVGDPDQVAFFTELQRESASAESAARAFEVNTTIDVTAAIEKISAPTLIIHRRSDPAVPFDAAREMAAVMPAAQFLPLEGDVHPPFFGDSDAVLDAIDAFLTGKAPGGRTPAGFPAAGPLTVLFTDLVGHTEMMSRLGDERGREVLREHERITRETLKAHGGKEIKTDGDSFMVSFASVSAAVECAVTLQRAFAEYSESAEQPIVVRMGLNAGEPIEEDGDLFGATVILASRIAAKAEGGEILVSDVVRGLCSGKGFLFADRGEFVAKGFEEPVRVYEVRWGE